MYFSTEPFYKVFSIAPTYLYYSDEVLYNDIQTLTDSPFNMLIDILSSDNSYDPNCNRLRHLSFFLGKFEANDL